MEWVWMAVLPSMMLSMGCSRENTKSHEALKQWVNIKAYAEWKFIKVHARASALPWFLLFVNKILNSAVAGGQREVEKRSEINLHLKSSLLFTDPSLPDVCQLQSLSLFPNYMTSDLQPQKVKGCTHPRGGEASPEVHVIKLRSAGSALSGWDSDSSGGPDLRLDSVPLRKGDIIHLFHDLPQLSASGGKGRSFASGGPFRTAPGCSDS